MYVIRRGAPGGEPPGLANSLAIGGSDLRQLVGQDGKTLSAKAKNQPWLRRLLKLRQAYPFVYLTDDGGPYYRRQALAQARRWIENGQINQVVSSFRPWSDHLVARQLKQTYPQLKWIADFRDLPVDQVRQDIWWPALQRWWGKQVIAPADEVWAVSQGQQAQLRSWHQHIRVVRNPLLTLPPSDNTPKTARFTITYTGSLYPGLQSIKPLLLALQTLRSEGTITKEKLCLQYRGKDAECFRNWTTSLPEQCLDIGPSIAPAAAQKMQHDAQALLLLSWSAPGYYGVLTAKLWDYLATGRPIIALVNGPPDPELTTIIEGGSAGAVFAQEATELTNWLRTAYTRWLTNGQLPWSVNQAKLRGYLL